MSPAIKPVGLTGKPAFRREVERKLRGPDRKSIP